MSEYAVVNPATGETVQTYPTIGDDELNEAIGRADAAHRDWGRSSTVEERAQLLRRVGEIYTEERQRLAEIIVREMGKRIQEAAGEVASGRRASSTTTRRTGPSLPRSRARSRWMKGEAPVVEKRSSVGVILAIEPWNYPLYQVVRVAGPNLVLGNAILLKHPP